MADKAVYQVFKEMTFGSISQNSDEFIESETAFIDTYGDYEEIVKARRKFYANTRRTILPLVQASTDYEAPQWFIAEEGLR